MTRTGRSKKGKGSPCASELVQYVTGDKRPDQTPPICFCGGLCVVFIALFLFPPTRLNGIAQPHSAQKAPICCKNSLESLTCHLRCVLHRTQRFLGGVPTYSGPHTLSQRPKWNMHAAQSPERGKESTHLGIAFGNCLWCHVNGVLGNPRMGWDLLFSSQFTFTQHVFRRDTERKPLKPLNQHFELQSNRTGLYTPTCPPEFYFRCL